MRQVNNVEMSTFLQDGRKEVVKFSAAPQVFASDEAAIDALNKVVLEYQHMCRKGYNEFRAPDNPFVVIIIHGIND